MTDHRSGTPITTLIFDVDDTLYDVGTGFSDHRNTEGAPRFMMDHLGFPTFASAKQIRDEYFDRYHSTTKALAVAEEEGRFPPNAPKFDPKDLDAYFATKLNFDLLGGKKERLANDLKECKLNLVIFSNGPRNYVDRILQELGLSELFRPDRVWGVTDTLPYAKPQKEAFDQIFQQLGVPAQECVFIEDSMKNIRVGKSLGLNTVLVAGAGRLRKNRSADLDAVEAKRYDAPDEDDPAVDVAIETVEELRDVLPGLWESPPVFLPPPKR